MAFAAGFEPATSRFEAGRSIRLSYAKEISSRRRQSSFIVVSPPFRALGMAGGAGIFEASQAALMAPHSVLTFVLVSAAILFEPKGSETFHG